MDPTPSTCTYEIKHMNETPKRLCRGCLTVSKQCYSILQYAENYKILCDFTISESDGLPQWLCYECVHLLIKCVKFKMKLLQAHELLNKYAARCAPFPVDGQDPELLKFESPELSLTEVMCVDNVKSKNGFHRVLQHSHQQKQQHILFNDVEPLSINVENLDELTLASNLLKEEGFSDYEDNICLEDYKFMKTTVQDVDEYLNNTQSLTSLETKEKRIKKKKKKPGAKDKKKIKKEPDPSRPYRSSIRKPLEIDPTKIRTIKLNPEQQVRQRQLDSQVGGYLKLKFKCELCYRGFNFESKLNNHMKKHSPSRGNFKCDLCMMYLPTMYSYNIHMLIHTQRYECLKCGRQMIDRGSIIEHYRSQHEGLVTQFTCQLCGKISSNYKTHRGHMRNRHSGERPQCDQCNKTFVNKDSLAEHILIHENVKNYECPICNRRFRTKTQVKHHQIKHSDVKEYYCVECDVRFKSAHNLRQHLIKSLKHKDVYSFQFMCNRCDKKFETSTALQHHHLVQHEGHRQYTCPECGAKLATKASLSKHVRSHVMKVVKEANHFCPTCGRGFTSKAILTNHLRTHTGEKPFSCMHCGRTFSQRTGMSTHIKLVHLNIRKLKKEPKTAEDLPEFALQSKTVAPKQEVFENWVQDPNTIQILYQ